MMEIQALIQEIQKKHQITLKPNDPVFVMVTLNDLLLSHYLEKFQALLETQNKLVVFESIERLNQASAMGSEMINRSLEALSQTLNENAGQITSHWIGVIETVRDEKHSQISKNVNCIAHWGSYIALAGGFFVLGMLFKAFLS